MSLKRMSVKQASQIPMGPVEEKAIRKAKRAARKTVVVSVVAGCGGDVVMGVFQSKTEAAKAGYDTSTLR